MTILLVSKLNKCTQVGVTFRRIPFETEIGIFPKMNPLDESSVERSGDAGDTMLPLTSAQTEDRLKEALHHRAREGDDVFQPIPLKRIDSGSHQHHIQVHLHKHYSRLDNQV